MWFSAVALGFAAPLAPHGPAPMSGPEGLQPDEDRVQKPPRVVVSVPAGPERERLAADLRRAATSAGHELELVVDPLPRSPASDDARTRAAASMAARWDADLMVWIDMSEPARRRIDVWSGSDGRLRSRTLTVPRAGPATAHETTVNVIASIIAEVAAQPVETTSDSEAPPATATEPATDPSQDAAAPPSVRDPAPKPWPRLWLGASYAGNSFADAMPWHSAVGVAVAWNPLRRLRLHLGFDGVFPARLETEAIAVSLHRYPIRLGLDVALVQRARFEFGLAVGGALDPVLRRTRIRDANVVARERRLRLFSSASAGLFAAWKPLARLRLQLDLAVEGVLSRARYVIRGSDSTPAVVLDPHPARVFARIGAHFGLWLRAERQSAQQPPRRFSSDP